MNWSQQSSTSVARTQLLALPSQCGGLFPQYHSAAHPDRVCLISIQFQSKPGPQQSAANSQWYAPLEQYKRQQTVSRALRRERFEIYRNRLEGGWTFNRDICSLCAVYCVNEWGGLSRALRWLACQNTHTHTHIWAVLG